MSRRAPALAVEASQHLRATPGEAFALLGDVAQLHRWQRGLRWARRGEAGPLGVGATMTAERSLRGIAARYTTEVSVWEPPRLARFTLTPLAPGGTEPLAGVGAEGSYRLEPADSGALLTARAELRLTGGLRLGPLARVVREELERTLHADLHGLARLTDELAA